MPNRNIIVIGGSSGATGPLREILARFRPDLPAAVFVVLHTAPSGFGALATVTSAAGKLPVREAEDGLKIENGHVYLAVPDRHLLLDGGHMALGRGPRENLSRPAIDPLFRSAALCCGPRVIGVVLSGRLSDGAAGLNAIKRCGGMTVVQHPNDALADDMPRRALEATTVDLCVAGTRIGDNLAELASEQAGHAVPIPPEIRLEVEIAAGGRADSKGISTMADPVPLTCPSCGGVLSIARQGPPLRFRCQVGHAYTVDTLATEKDSQVDEALRVALRISEERAELVRRLAKDCQQSGRLAIARSYDAKADEYRKYADVIRRVMLELI